MVSASDPVPGGENRFCKDEGSGAGRRLPSEAGLGRSERILQEYEYRKVTREGRLIAGKAFKAYFLIRRGLERKAGFIAGRRVGNACLRNRAKRLLKEAYRKLKADLETSGFNVVFVAKRATPLATFDEIRNEMAWMFEKNGLLKRA
jgi:ribonuclease P protein component